MCILLHIINFNRGLLLIGHINGYVKGTIIGYIFISENISLYEGYVTGQAWLIQSHSSAKLTFESSDYYPLFYSIRFIVFLFTGIVLS